MRWSKNSKLVSLVAGPAFLLFTNLGFDARTAAGASSPSEIPTSLPTGGISSADLPGIDISAILPESVMTTILGTIGILTNHRPYQPATSLGLLGIEFGVEATLVHLPDSFMSSFTGLGSTSGASRAGRSRGLAAATSSGSENPIPSLPMARFHLHKGFGSVIDAGFSGLYFNSISILGGDLKATVYEPDEGPTWAVRLNYSRTSLDFGKLGLATLPIEVNGVDLGSAGFRVTTQTITPQVLVSKKLHFSNPYIGAGFEWTTGQVEIPITLRVLGTEQVLRSKSYRKSGLSFFTGVGFRLIPIKIAMEGGFSTIGMHYVGATIGFCI